jgi:hypothetical protein
VDGLPRGGENGQRLTSEQRPAGVTAGPPVLPRGSWRLALASCSDTRSCGTSSGRVPRALPRRLPRRHAGMNTGGQSWRGGPEVAQRERAQRLVALHRACTRHPSIEERDGLLPAGGRAEYECAGLGEVPEQRIAALAEGADTGRTKGRQDGLAAQDPAPAKAVWAISRARSTSVSVIPSAARRPAAEAIARDVVSPSSQPRPSFATRWRVPRRGQERTISPASQAASTAAPVVPATRRPPTT